MHYHFVKRFWLRKRGNINIMSKSLVVFQKGLSVKRSLKELNGSNRMDSQSWLRKVFTKQCQNARGILWVSIDTGWEVPPSLVLFWQISFCLPCLSYVYQGLSRKYWITDHFGHVQRKEKLCRWLDQYHIFPNKHISRLCLFKGQN